jgi:hypothetical protein
MSERISPAEVRHRIDAGEDVLLVCGYDDEQRCEDVHIEGALTMSEFRRQQNQIPKNAEIVFFCG